MQSIPNSSIVILIKFVLIRNLSYEIPNLYTILYINNDHCPISTGIPNLFLL